jgi:hypothetical protein
MNVSRTKSGVLYRGSDPQTGLTTSLTIKLDKKRHKYQLLPEVSETKMREMEGKRE